LDPRPPLPPSPASPRRPQKALDGIEAVLSGVDDLAARMSRDIKGRIAQATGPLDAIVQEVGLRQEGAGRQGPGLEVISIFKAAARFRAIACLL
jgi:hypothetical protein